MKIWIDMDGVISEFNPNAIRVARELWPKMNIPRNYVPQDYEYSDLFTPGQWDAVWTEIKKIPDFWLRQGPLHENVSALREWMPGTEHEIFFITSRRSTGGVGSRPQTILWLHQYGLYPKENPPTVITVNGAKEKKKHIAELGIQMGIDDLPATVAETNLLPGHSCYLLDQPWNRESPQPRMKSLKSFLDMIDSASHWT